MHTGVLVQGLKQSQHEADHSNPSINEVKNKYSYTSTLPYMPSRQGQGELYFYVLVTHKLLFIQ
jgi:hypothetical protein